MNAKEPNLGSYDYIALLYIEQFLQHLSTDFYKLFSLSWFLQDYNHPCGSETISQIILAP